MSENKPIKGACDKFIQKSDLVYKFIYLQNEYINIPRDYGTGEVITMIEMHTLSDIESNPGITVTELSQIWRKTKGAVSQTVSKLEKKGYIYRERHSENGKKFLLYATESGIKLNSLHKAYDLKDLQLTLEDLLNHCSIEEINIFFKVLSCYNKMLEEECNQTR